MPNNRSRHLRLHSGAGQNRRSQSAVNATVDICHQLFYTLRIVGAGTMNKH